MYVGCFRGSLETIMGQMSAAFRKSGRVVAIAAVAGAAAGVLAVGATAQQRSASVNIVNFAFTPQTVTVAAKAPITWTNKDDAPHQAVVSGKGSTAVLQKGKSGRL